MRAIAAAKEEMKRSEEFLRDTRALIAHFEAKYGERDTPAINSEFTNAMRILMDKHESAYSQGRVAFSEGKSKTLDPHNQEDN